MIAASRLHAAAETSALIRAVRRLGAFIAKAARRRPVDPVPAVSSADELDLLLDAFAQARLGRLIVPAVARLGDSWRSSRITTTARAALNALARRDPADRTRAVGIAVLAAALTDLAVTPLDPRPVSAARWALWFGAAALGVGLTRWPRHAAAAWVDWRTRRRVEAQPRG
jgi:hypothetical protein